MNGSTPFAANRNAWTLLLGLIAFVYLYQAPYFNYLNNPNENVRVYMTRSMVEDGTFAIDSIIAEWGYVNDKATFDGRMFPGKAPGVSYLAVPAYWAHYQLNQRLDRTASKHEIVTVCRIGGCVIPLLLFFLWFARFTGRVVTDPALRMGAVVALALGSTMLTYGGIFASHALMAASLFGGYMLIYRHREDPLAWIPPVGIGFLLAWAVVLEYPAGLGAAVVGFYGLWRSPTRVRFTLLSAAGMVIPLVLLFVYHQKAFGGPLELPYSHLENPEFVEHVSGGFFGMERLSGTALHGSYFAPSNGLFWFLPWTMMSVVGLVFALHFRRLREPALVTLLVLVVYSLFIAMVHNWRGGWTAGPRYIVVIVPFLAWSLLVFLAELRRTELGLPVICVTFALIGAAMFSCGVSAAMFPHFPEGIENPIFEIGGFLVSRGYGPHSVGSALGVEGAAGLIPVLIAHAVAFAVPFFVLIERDSVERLTVGAVALALACGFVALQSVPTTANESYLRTNQALVSELWEPVPPEAHEMLRHGTLPSDVRYGRADATRLRQLAAQAARRGLSETAAELYDAANRAPSNAPGAP